MPAQSSIATSLVRDRSGTACASIAPALPVQYSSVHCRAPDHVAAPQSTCGHGYVRAFRPSDSIGPTPAIPRPLQELAQEGARPRLPTLQGVRLRVARSKRGRGHTSRKVRAAMADSGGFIRAARIARTSPSARRPGRVSTTRQPRRFPGARDLRSRPPRPRNDCARTDNQPVSDHTNTLPTTQIGRLSCLSLPSARFGH